MTSQQLQYDVYRARRYHDEDDVPHVVGGEPRRLAGQRHGRVLVLLVAVRVRRHLRATLDVCVQIPLLNKASNMCACADPTPKQSKQQ